MVFSLKQVTKYLGHRPRTYSAVPSASSDKSLRTSDEESLDDQDETHAMLKETSQYSSPRSSLRFRVLTTFTVICVFGLTTAGAFLFGRSFDVDEKCMRHSFTYCTLGKNSDFSGHWGDPNEAMDRNWNKWGFVKYASFSEDEFAAMGMDLEGSAKFTEEYGGGYIGFLEISHQMHAYHWDYYQKPENKIWADWLNDNDITIKVHINHCFEMLRQLIMCNSDLGVIPHHWVKDIQDPYANFNTVHKCRDLDSVAEWIEQHEVRAPPATGYPMPADSKVWARPP